MDRYILYKKILYKYISINNSLTVFKLFHFMSLLKAAPLFEFRDEPSEVRSKIKKKRNTKPLEFDLLRNVRHHHDILLPLDPPTPNLLMNSTTTKCFSARGKARTSFHVCVPVNMTITIKVKRLTSNFFLPLTFKHTDSALSLKVCA